MSVQVATCTVDQLISKCLINGYDASVDPIVSTEGNEIRGLLSIPEYQRPYCWTETQIKRLLNDFSLHHKALQNKPDDQQCDFYLGSIILHQKENDGVLNIIDGQQRLTTLLLIAYVMGRYTDLSLCFESPESQQQIRHNLIWLRSSPAIPESIAFSKINLSLVVTDSEDEAYNFFETQNTGGVRLKGPDIIKAHHLRAIDENDKAAVNRFALLWESLGDLAPVVDTILRGRYWQNLRFRQYPLHNQSNKIRQTIVSELADATGKGDDIAYGRIARIISDFGGESLVQSQVGYELRQPLNSGVNVIHYLRYFEYLRKRYLEIDKKRSKSDLSDYEHFYRELICRLDGCGYLKQLYDACLLTYISQFGDKHLLVAALKLFRVVYSRRVENQTAVKEKSIPSFVKETPILDWIALSYTPQELFEKLDSFKLKVDLRGLSPDDNSVKKRFVKAVNIYFKLNVKEVDFARDFGKSLSSYLLKIGADHV